MNRYRFTRLVTNWSQIKTEKPHKQRILGYFH
nr:MAG TPA: hypothetical protein [Caudoviricetes sp.]